jgi:prepilin-type N-terminal cleavage/methylation domain-containing protein
MHRRAFTLIEFLVVAGIVAVLAIAVVLVVNPGEALRKSRDTVRLLDLKTINDAVFAYTQAIGGSLGSSSVTYVSIPDPTATTTAGTDCSGLGFFVGRGAFHCPASSTFRDPDGTGWIPVNLSKAPYDTVSALPIDPVNTTSSNHYYIYQTDGTNYKITAAPESQALAATAATNQTPFIRGTLPFGTYLFQFGSSGSGNGQFGNYFGSIAVDTSGNVYVGDPGNYRVEKFSSGN